MHQDENWGTVEGSENGDRMNSQQALSRMTHLKEIFLTLSGLWQIQLSSMFSDSSFSCEKVFAAQDLEFQK